MPGTTSEIWSEETAEDHEQAEHQEKGGERYTRSSFFLDEGHPL